MSKVELPAAIGDYFRAKHGSDVDKTLACFSEEATVTDIGEDLELQGLAQIREWITGRVAGYDLTSEVISGELRGDDYIANVVVSGNFPGSPYQFEIRFRLKDEKILELVIDPIGSLAE